MKWTAMFALLIALCLPAVVRAGDKDVTRPEVKEATDKEAEHELTVFEREFDTVDIDYKLQAVKRLGKCVHDDVTKELLKLLYRDPDVHVRAAAAEGLAHQAPNADLIGRKTTRLLKQDDLDPKILVALVRTLGKLDFRKAGEEIMDLISNDDDDVVIACFDVLGDWKDLRAHREIQMFWEMYPEEGKWTTGSVTVDTGASGGEDKAAAKAKWKAKYGSRAKLRPRPKCVKALKAAVEKMTGEKIEKPEAFRKWCSDHKREIKAAERKR